MIGNTKFKIGETVYFDFDGQKKIGVVQSVNDCGAFEYDQLPSYSIHCDKEDKKYDNVCERNIRRTAKAVVDTPPHKRAPRFVLVKHDHENEITVSFFADEEQAMLAMDTDWADATKRGMYYAVDYRFAYVIYSDDTETIWRIFEIPETV